MVSCNHESLAEHGLPEHGRPDQVSIDSKTDGGHCLSTSLILTCTCVQTFHRTIVMPCSKLLPFGQLSPELMQLSDLKASVIAVSHCGSFVHASYSLNLCISNLRKLIAYFAPIFRPVKQVEQGGQESSVDKGSAQGRWSANRG